MSLITHGVSAYDKYGCRCQVCRSAKSEKNCRRKRGRLADLPRMSPQEAGKLGAQAAMGRKKEEKEKRMAEYLSNPALCRKCGKPISYEQNIHHGIYCSRECRRIYDYVEKKCVECGFVLPRRRGGKAAGAKYCSTKCQNNYQHKQYIEKWLSGDKLGGYWCGVSHHVRRWLIDTRGEKCEECGWDKRHAKSGRVPLHVDHKDGNPYNHRPENLRIMCPNCHSLTPNFGNYNKGNGRKERYAGKA